MESAGEMSSRVYVTQYSDRLDFKEAERYGRVKFLSESEFRAEPALLEANSRVRNEILEGLSGYITGQDYILLTGSPIPSVIIGDFIGKRVGIHRILKWNNHRRSYDLVKIKVD